MGENKVYPSRTPQAEHERYLKRKAAGKAPKIKSPEALQRKKEKAAEYTAWKSAYNWYIKLCDARGVPR